jgi:putative transposase
MNTLKSHAHCVYNLHIHIVFVTKYRKKVITSAMLERMGEIFTKLCETQKCKLTEFNGEADHVHLLIDLAPDIAISKLVNILKTISSREIRKEFKEHLAKLYCKPVFWTSAYCAISAGGAPLSILKDYIQSQDSPKSEDPDRS